MPVSAYHSDVLALLRDDYGVIDAELGRGGSHPRVTFTYDGSPQHITINNRAHGPGAFDMKRRDIRRLLGDPPPRPARVRRTMEEMMTFNTLLPQAPAVSLSVSSYPMIPIGRLPIIIAQGRLAIYADRVRFEVPTTVANAFGVTEEVAVGIAMSASGDPIDAWNIARVDGQKRPALHYSAYSKRYEIDALAPGLRTVDADPCGLSPAEYTIEDGVILVQCPLETRVPLAPNSGKQNRRKAAMVEAPTADPVLTDRQSYIAQLINESMEREAAKLDTIVATATEAEVRTCLDALRRIEATTPYRLGRRKVDGGWCFSAPRIE